MPVDPEETALELIEHHGREALTEARRRHDVCLALGAADEAASWDRVYAAILMLAGLPRDQ